jgi:lysophospholipase L1-like esterase
MRSARESGKVTHLLCTAALALAFASGCGDESGGGGSSSGGGGPGGGGHGGEKPSNSGSTGGGGSGGEGGGTPVYNPCPPSDTCFVMPLGDSITDGVGSSDGSSYRKELRALVDADGGAMDLVGTVPGPSGHHEGHSGWVIQQIRDSIDGFLSGCTDSTDTHEAPHVVLLMIGTNDTNGGFELSSAPARLGDLMDRIAVDVPDALLVVAQIVPNGDENADSDKVAPFNAAIPDLVSARAAAGQHVVRVDMHAALDPTTDFSDALHPNDAGYVKMADVWYSVLKPLLSP